MYVVHVYSTHAYKVALYGVDIINEMEGQKRDVNIFPANGLNQVQNGLT